MELGRGTGAKNVQTRGRIHFRGRLGKTTCQIGKVSCRNDHKPRQKRKTNCQIGNAGESGHAEPRVGNQSGNGRPPVKSASQTYLLSLAPAEFEQVTRAIMLQSNKAGKLRGFGQCIAAWLRQWIDGEFGAARLVAARHRDHPAGPAHQIYVGLGPETTRVFKECRTHLGGKSASPITVTSAIGALVDLFLDDHDNKALDNDL
jgi:hypothetical protein